MIERANSADRPKSHGRLRGPSSLQVAGDPVQPGLAVGSGYGRRRWPLPNGPAFSRYGEHLEAQPLGG